MAKTKNGKGVYQSPRAKIVTSPKTATAGIEA
jgi:hypothetical protein